MRDAIEFVKGGISKKSFASALVHFQIHDGWISAFNGRIALRSPIPLEFTAMPHAEQMLKAIAACKGKIDISIVGEEMLIHSGRFKTYVQCWPKEFEIPHKKAETSYVSLFPAGLMSGLRAIAPFIGIDASRDWSSTVLFTPDGCINASNNIVIIQYWIGHTIPQALCLSGDAVAELLRIKEEPISIAVNPHYVYFLYEGNRYLQAWRHVNDWPTDARDILSGIFGAYTPALDPMPQEVISATKDLTPFKAESNQIYFRDGGIATSDQDKVGTFIELESTYPEVGYHFDNFKKITETATHFSFTSSPSFFKGENLRGAIVKNVITRERYY